MTRYVVEAHYDGDHRELFGDPPFHNIEAAAEFGDNLIRIAKAIQERNVRCGTSTSGLILTYRVRPLNHS